MVLSNGFFYERIQLDTINERFNKVPTAKEGDANGRGMIVVLTENGLVNNTTGVSLLFKWEHTRISGAQGLEDFEPLDLTKGEYIVTYPTEMNHEGYVKAEIRIIDNGKYAGSRNMKIQVEPSVGDDTAMESSNQFSALVTALLQVNSWNTTIDGKIVEWEDDMAATKQLYIDKMNEVDTIYPIELNSVKQQLAEITPQVTLTDLKAKTYNVGDKISSAVYGGSTWIVKNAADLKFQWSYQLDYDDELHVIVNLKGGGTAIAECQIASIIDYAKSLNKKAMTKYYLNINEYKAVKLGFYGDSLLYGQYNGDGAVVAIGTAVNQEYPRVHEFNHLQKPIPTIVKETLLSVYHDDGEFVSIDNRARSGDTITDCYRGCRVNKNYDVALFEFGVNDAALCTAGGSVQANITDPANINNVFVTTDVYKKLLVREMLRGSGVIIMTPHRYYNVPSSTATRKFADSFKKMAKELDVLCLDWNEFIGDYEIHKITHDNIHFNAFGAEAIGKRLAGVLIGRGYDITDKICGERQMTVSKLKDNIITVSSSYENWNSFSPSFYSAGQSDDISLGNTSPIFYPFYLEEDKKLVMPIGRVQTATGSITYEIDFGLTQPEFKLDIEVADRFADNGAGGLTNLNKAPAASKTVVNTAEILEFNSKYINRPQDIDTHLCIQGRGWHVLTIKNNTADVVMINGVRFFNADVPIAKVDAY